MNPSTADQSQSNDPVNHPKHYTSHPSGVECITITRHMSFNIGNAIKYLWRADEKGAAIEDLKKAAWYIADEIAKRENKSGTVTTQSSCPTCNVVLSTPVWPHHKEMLCAECRSVWIPNQDRTGWMRK